MRKPSAQNPLTPYGNRPMVTPIVHAVNYEYLDFEVLRKITDGEVDGYTYHRDDNPTVRAVEKKIAEIDHELLMNYDETIAEPGFFESYQGFKDELEALMEQWEALSTELESQR